MGSIPGPGQTIEIQGDLAGPGGRPDDHREWGRDQRPGIAQFGGSGILISGGSGDLVESRHRPGCRPGTGNVGDGVTIANSSGNTIGGTASAAGNVISGNGANGIHINTGEGNVILGNLVGTDGVGEAVARNSEDGVLVENSSNDTIGGTTPTAGNVISGNGANGIHIDVGDGNVILGNLIGVDDAGLNALGNAENGVLIDSSSEDRIGGAAPGSGNLISGNGRSGISIANSSSNSDALAILGNQIGTDTSGQLPLGNVLDGISAVESSNDTIGGTAPGSGNLVSGNGGNGISIINIASIATGNAILGNFLGTDSSGETSVGNGKDGLLIDNGTNDTIGGSAEGARNVISGNDGNGIHLSDGGTGTIIVGNFLGTDLSGTSEVSNARDGIFLDGVSDNTVGGTTAESRNVVSGNTLNGVEIGGVPANGNIVEPADGNVILGNLIGPGVDYLSPAVTDALANGNGNDGIKVNGTSGDVSGNTIGGTVAGSRNVIANNLGNGVEIVGVKGGTGDELIVGNVIGVDTSSGFAAGFGNQQSGLKITSSSDNQVGGQEPADRNIISGNTRDGIEISGGIGNTLEGNFIGSDAAGISDLANLESGAVQPGEWRQRNLALPGERQSDRR